MKDAKVRVRAPGKPAVKAMSKVTGAYPAVWGIVETAAPAAASKMAAMVRQLVDEGLVQDYSQVALLTFSTRETSRAIGAYTKALDAAGVPYYNPRSAQAQKDDRLKAMIGALSFIIDPEGFYEDPDARLPRSVPKYIEAARAALEAILTDAAYRDLAAYLVRCVDAVQASTLEEGKSNRLVREGGRRVTLSHLLYKLLAYEPFATDLLDRDGGERLKALNVILSEYESLYFDGELLLEKGPDGTAQVARSALYSFYGVLVEGIHDGLNDPEDDEISVQHGAVNVMTIHQSKGLEFDVVFVLRPDKQPFLGDTHVLEDELYPYISRPTKPALRRSADLRAAEDAIRLFYVAYSRAKALLVLTGSGIEAWDRVLGRTTTGRHLNTAAALQSAGVRIV